MLSLTPGTTLWGHTSAVGAAQISSRGKAVSVAVGGNELRIWELEGLNSGVRRRRGGLESSVRVRGMSRPLLKPEVKELNSLVTKEQSSTVQAFDRQDGDGKVVEKSSRKKPERKHWLGFDDEVVIVLNGTANQNTEAEGGQKLVVYDFT